MSSYRFWTIREINLLKANPHLSDRKVGEMIGRSESAVQQGRKRYIPGPKENTSSFPKGHTPFNKGKRLAETHTPEGIANSARTRFKKGDKPVNHNRALYTVFERNENGQVQTFIKLPHNRQYRYSWYVYEQHYGVRPKPGEVIRFRDGNRRNFSPENLWLVSRAQNALLNTNREKQSRTARAKKAGVLKGLMDMGFSHRDFQTNKKTA